MKKVITILTLFFAVFISAQTKQAILISHQYNFQSEKDSYNINNMFKGILMSYFDVYFDDEELPIEIAQNSCNALKADLIDNSNVFATKLKFVFKDCQNKILFESIEVKSKDKSSQTGYIETIKMLAPEVQRYMASKSSLKKIPEQNSTEISKKNETTVASNSINVKYKFLEIQNGFAILDATPKVVLQIYRTSVQDVFIADKFGKKGVFYKKDNKWYLEYYDNDKLVTEEFVF